MTQQHVLYGIKVVERERDGESEKEMDFGALFRDSLLPGRAGTHFTRRSFKITDLCANDLGQAQLLSSSGGFKTITFITLV
jgi:hypothetical protein